jgi:hypothetical protein
MIAALEQSGFSAIWINARAYADQGDSVIRDLTSHQRSEWLLRTPAPIRVVRLQPKAEPTLPDLDEFHHHRAWSGQTAGRTELALVALHGWYPLETDGDRVWRWARKRAEVGVWSPDDTPRARLTFRATALRDDVLELRHNGKTLLKVPLISGKVQSFETPLHLSAGNNRLLWVIQGDLTHPPGGDSRKLGFMVEALKVQPDVQPP